MLKRVGTIFIILIVSFVFIGLTLAEGKANARKGKYLYRKSCRTCHCEGGSAKPLSPIDKTQAEWDEVFQNIDKLACAKEWDKFSEKDKADMYAHLWGHAFDSPSPAKCK